MSFFYKRTWGPEPNYPNVLKASKMLETPIIIAGPCSIESREQIDRMMDFLHFDHMKGLTFFCRGGVFRAGTYPPKEFGLKIKLLEYWHKTCKGKKIKNIVEILDIRQIDKIEPYADAFQVGARHCQDYALLTELSKSQKVVTLKRNPGMTLDEFLGAAEYLCKNSCMPVLIERGSATHMNHVRWDLSISLIAAIKKMTNLPILVDASHGTGRSDLVEPMTLAGLAAGADGFLLEVHENPAESLSDRDQAITPDAARQIISKASRIWNARL